MYARCRLPILPGQRWDLDHVDGDKIRYNGPAHSHCNRSAGGRLGRAMQKRKPTPKVAPARVEPVAPNPKTHPHLTFRDGSWFSREW